LLPILGSLFVLGGPVQAAPLVLYQNGTFTGTVNALVFNNGIQVSDSFNIASATQAVSVQFATWTNVATPTTRLDWIISTQQAAAGFGTILAQASNQAISSTFLFNNGPSHGNFNVWSNSFNLPTPLNLTAGTYFLTFFNGVTPGSAFALWDESGGPSQVFQRDSLNNYPVTSAQSNYFQILGPDAGPAGAPEMDPHQSAVPVLMALMLLSITCVRRPG